MNIRAWIGKKGYDFCSDGAELCCEDKEGYSYSSDMTKTEKEIYRIGYENGRYTEREQFQAKIKELFGIM